MDKKVLSSSVNTCTYPYWYNLYKVVSLNSFYVNSQGKSYEITKYPKNEGVKISRWIGNQTLNISELQSRIFLLDSTFKFDPNASKKDLVKSYFDVYYEKGVYLWDIAAGIALVNASGGKYLLTKMDEPYKYEVLASNSGIFEKALQKLTSNR